MDVIYSLRCDNCIPLFQVATASQFFISYTIRTFGALTFATIMTTRQVDTGLDHQCCILAFAVLNLSLTRVVHMLL
jgi:hypothetical protein